jgi:quercetin dioxygenase-like cupin family protein
VKWIFMLAALSIATTSIAKSKGLATFVEAKEIKWTEPLDPKGVPVKGVHTATVDGDPAKGPHHTFMKFDAGFSVPVHHHSADHFVTVVAGTLVMTVDGQEHRLTPGSYFAFKNKQEHTTACAKGDDCIIFADVRGKWDVVMPTEKK